MVEIWPKFGRKMPKKADKRRDEAIFSIDYTAHFARKMVGNGKRNEKWRF
jgi:hypothetical protein